MSDEIINFKKINFYNKSFNSIFLKINKGGYLVAPAASSLSKIYENKIYYNSLIKSDVAILDSGLLCILLRIFKGSKISKLSGYRFLKKFLNIKSIKNKKFLLIDPNYNESIANKNYLKKINIFNVISYVAPLYKKKIIDKKLIRLINKEKPKYIIINIGGERQEILASYIKKKVNFKVSIFCTGAAIAFLTKRQAPINDFIDKYYLGWFVRLVHNPRKYISRILSSFYLVKLFFE